MTKTQLFYRNLTHYWRTNLAVIAGVAAAVAVLSGALLVGDSVRASLSDLVLLRLGETSFVITSENFFRDELADELALKPDFQSSFAEAAPLIALDGVVSHETSGRRASGVLVYGVDARFWLFNGQGEPPLGSREVLLSPSLAAEFGAATGDSLLVRIPKPSAVPVDSLHSDKDSFGATLRLNVAATLDADQLGEFTVRPQQGAVRAVFVSLERLQIALEQQGRVNGILVSDPPPEPPGADSEARRGQLEDLLRSTYSLRDVDVEIIELPTSGPGLTLSIESGRVTLDESVTEAVRSAILELGWETTGVFTYLANTIRIRNREVPYSLVSALDGDAFASLPNAAGSRSEGDPPPLWLNDWAWSDLGASQGDTVELDYYVWHEGGRLETRTAEFKLLGSVEMIGLGGDRRLAPTFPGLSDSPTVAGWDPPFPVDLDRIRPRDEDYWEVYRTAPKAFIPLEVGQQLWRTRYGELTAVRLNPPSETPSGVARARTELEVRERLDPVAAGMAVYAARAAGTQASRGAIDFGLYFISFSFFIVVSAVLLASLFFRLGIEQRLREIGLLKAIGFGTVDLRRLFLGEGILLSALGSLIGVAGAVAYGALMMHGLRTWWVDGVGTTFLRLEIAPLSLAIGFVGGMATAAVCIWWTLRGLQSLSPRSLIAGSGEAAPVPVEKRRNVWRWTVAATLAAFALLGASWAELLDVAAGFFGAGALLLTASLCAGWGWLASRKRQAVLGATSGLVRMGFRNASWRPGRSLLSIGMMASAAFIIVSVDAFRRGIPEGFDRSSGTGGFALLGESLLPIAHDMNADDGRGSLSFNDQELDTLRTARFFSFRLRPGEDVSCLNLYQPRDPRVLGVPDELIEEGRFSFQSSVAATPEERANPWELLRTDYPDGAIPAIADAHTLTYILKLKPGEDFVIEHEGRSLRLRLVAALADSIFQSELLISEANFMNLFPYHSGFRVFLIDAAPDRIDEVASALEEGLADSGLDVMPARERLETFHRVESTYISTFQSLGGLGLLLGTLGLSAVMLRNVLERRREMALLRATGYRASDLATLVVAENAVLLFGGLLSGVVSAGLAILPALLARGTGPSGSVTWMLVGVVLVGLLASVAAVIALLRAPLLADLRSE